MISNKAFVVVDSQPDSKGFFKDLFSELKNKGFRFIFLKSGGRADGQEKNIYCGPDPDSLSGRLAFLLLLPGLRLVYFFYFLVLKMKHQVAALVCFEQNEKILLSSVARLLNLKLIWIEKPGRKVKGRGFLKSLYRYHSNRADVFVFSNCDKEKMKAFGMKEKNIRVIYPGIKLNRHEFQHNIFCQLAQQEGGKMKKKFFTVGTVASLEKSQHIEPLLQAIKICAEIISNIQLIIIGDGQERKNLVWAAKKMGIESMVWFVGEQEHLRKWLDSFDMFVVSCENPKMNDLEVILKTMIAGLPVIAPKDRGLEEIILENKTGCLLEIANSEMLARQIIKLYQDKYLRSKLGQLAKERVEENFDLAKQVEQFNF